MPILPPLEASSCAPEVPHSPTGPPSAAAYTNATIAIATVNAVSYHATPSPSSPTDVPHAQDSLRRAAAYRDATYAPYAPNTATSTHRAHRTHSAHAHVRPSSCCTRRTCSTRRRAAGPD